MLRAAVLFQLTIWITTVHAFFIWHPECADGGCENKPSRRGELRHRTASVEAASAEGGDAVFKLVQRIPDASASLETRVSISADRLRRKYSPFGRLGPRRGVAQRDNKFRTVSPASPTGPNAVGVFQDGTDFSYFIQAGFGATSKPLYMLLDTGAGTTWLMGSDCKSTACTMHSQYGPVDSTTYQANSKGFSISYGSGKVAGTLATDSIAVAGAKVNMLFGVANDTSNDFASFPFDGILGLSMAMGATDNFLQTLKSQKALSSNIFAVSLSRNSDGPNTGEVMFGGTNPAKFTGDISYTPVAAAANGDWAVPMDDILYDGKKAGVAGRLAYVDTGTTYIFGPASDVSALHKQIPGAKSNDEGVSWTVPCDSKALGVTFSGITYSISPKDWIAAGNGDCASNIYGHEVVKDSWLFGDVFLKNVYSVFDMDQMRLGFAKKADANPPTNTTPSTANPTASTAPTGVTPQPGTATQMPGLSTHETSRVTPTATGTPNATQTSRADRPGGGMGLAIMLMMAVVAMAI